MVLPWLIVGASAAIEMRRREQPAVKDRERVRALRRLQTMERELSKQKTAFDEKFSVRPCARAAVWTDVAHDATTPRQRSAPLPLSMWARQSTQDGCI